jgi:small subunit ribosomal protein S7
MRRPVKNRNKPGPDHLYQSPKVGRFINYVMWDGKKSVAESIVYNAFEIIKTELNENPVEVFEAAMRNAGPTVEVRSRRLGGANYQVPREVRPERRTQLAMTWMIAAARGAKGVTMQQALAKEIISASKNEGSAVKKKDDTHRMAEANKAFAHLSW